MSGGHGILLDDGTELVQTRKLILGTNLSVSYDSDGMPQIDAGSAPGAHVLADTTGLGSSHTTSGLTTGQVLRATGATTAAFQSLIATDLPSHVLADTTGLGAQHSTSGLTTGQVLRATGATTAAFQALIAADLPSHNHDAGDITTGALAEARGGLGSDFTDVFNMITGTPGGSTWQTLAHPNTGTNKYLQASGSGGTRSIGWVDAPAGTIGGTVSSPYIPYASGADTLANSPLTRASATAIRMTNAATVQFQLRPSGALAMGYYTAYGYTNTPGLRFYTSEGSEGSEAAVNGIGLAQLIAYGYDGTAYEVGAGIQISAVGTWGTGGSLNHEAHLTINTRGASDGTWAARWRFAGNGTFYPLVDNAYQIGAASSRVSIVYVNEINAEVGGVGDPSYTFESYETTGMYKYASSGVAFADAGTLAMSVTSSRTKIHSSKLLLDDGDATVADGEIGLSESGGTFYMSGRSHVYFRADNDGNAGDADHGFFWQNGSPATTRMGLYYESVYLNDWMFRVYDGYYKANIFLVGSSTGDANVAYIAFFERDGSTRQGYIGLGSSSDNDLNLYSDVGEVQIGAAGGTVRIETNLEVNGSQCAYVDTAAGPSTFYQYQYAYQSDNNLFFFRRAEGTHTTPTATADNAVLGQIAFQGYDTAWETGARILAQATEPWSTAEDTCLRFATHNGTTLADRWWITADGHWQPWADSTYNIGSNTLRPLNVYADNLHGAGANITGLSASQISSGVLGTTYGGTGQNLSSAAQGSVLAINSVGTISVLSGVTDGYVLTYESGTDQVVWAAPPSGIGGSGTANRLSRFTAGSTIGNSPLSASAATGSVGLIGNAVGTSNTAVLNFYDSTGSTLQGYVGPSNAGNSSFYIQSATGTVIIDDTCTISNLLTASGGILSAGHVDPSGGNTYDLGDTTNYWRYVYFNDCRSMGAGAYNSPAYTWNTNTDVGWYYTTSPAAGIAAAVDSTRDWDSTYPPMTITAAHVLFSGVGVYARERDWGDRSGATTCNFQDTNNHYMRMTASLTITISNLTVQGGEMVIAVGADSSGPYTITWSGVGDWATAEDNTVAALSTNFYVFRRVNGTVVGWVSSSDTCGPV